MRFPQTPLRLMTLQRSSELLPRISSACKNRLKKFAENGQLSIFSGNWFDTGEYNLTPEADLILTAHYLEALQMQAKAAPEIAGLLGGKILTS